MQLLPSEMSDVITTTCLCWRLSRRDGLGLGLTEHDRGVEFGGVVFAPGATLSAGSFETNADLRPSRADASGALSSEAITESDLHAGLWDGARVDVYRVDWRAPDTHTLIWSGRLSEISHGESGFEVELVSLKAELERPVGRVFSRRCDAVLGDDRCTVDPEGRVCDQRFETCRDVFQNAVNFRGFPHLPGNDFILSGPAATNNDGGQR